MVIAVEAPGGGVFDRRPNYRDGGCENDHEARTTRPSGP